MDGLVVKCSWKQLIRGPNQNPRSLDKCNFEVTNENNMIGVSFTLFSQFILKRAGFNHHFLFLEHYSLFNSEILAQFFIDKKNWNT